MLIEEWHIPPNPSTQESKQWRRPPDLTTPESEQRQAQSCRGLQGDPLHALRGDTRDVFKSMLEKEEHLAEEWACFYHSYSHPALVYEVQAAIAKVLFGFNAEHGALPRLLKHPFQALPDANAVLRAFPSWPDRDHNPAFKSVGICCSTSLVSSDPEATPTDVFSNGYCVSKVDIKSIVEKLLQAVGVPKKLLQMIIQKIMKLAEMFGLPQVLGSRVLQGHLLQIFIHRSCVDRLAYASLPFGVHDLSRHPLSKSLASSGQIAGQARLIVNPGDFLQDNAVKMYTYSADPFFNTQRCTFQDALCHVLSQVLNGSTYQHQDQLHIGQVEVEALCLAIAHSSYSEADVLIDAQTALKEAGYTDDELPTVLKESGYSASDLNGLGYASSALRKAGYSLTALVDAGYQDVEIFQAGFADAAVLSAGFSAAALKAAGYSASMLKEAGYDARALKKARYAFASVVEAGYADDDVLKAGFPASDLRSAGYSAAALRGAGYTDEALVAVGYSLDTLHAAGCAAATLRKAGCAARALQEVGYSVDALQNASYTKAEVLGAGYPVEALQAASYSVVDLRKAGYTAEVMRIAGCSATALKMGGYADTEISEANYAASALQEAGCSLGAHRDTVKAIAAVWRNSLQKAGQDIDDTMIEFLTTAALDATDEEDLSQLLEDYLGECCGQTLKDLLALGLGSS